MPTAVPNGLRRVAARLTPDSVSDGELLRQFLDHRNNRTRNPSGNRSDGEAAFAVLVRRHAAMVLGTCRRVLGHAADADDAFQAALLVLVRKAYTLTDRACVGNFLYGVAFHTALKAKAMAAKRRAREARAERRGAPAHQPELLAALDEELARLPDKYREPVVLCELEGRSRRETAAALGVPEGTLSSRLASAHRMLEKRLKSRGFGAVSVASLLTAQAGGASEALSDAAVRAASVGPTRGVSLLVSEVTKMLLLHKLGIGAAALLAVVAVAVGLALAASPGAADEKPAPQEAAGKKPVAAAPARAVDEEPVWKAEFRKTYGLKDGELVRRVAPPHPACRAEYFRDEIRELYKRSKLDAPEEELNRDYTDYFVKFGWKDGWTVPALRTMTTPVKPEAGVTLARVLEATTEFGRTRVEADDDLLERKVTGDFVVRAGADTEKVAAAMETILRKECDIPASLAVAEAERDVYVLSGKYESKPLADRKKDQIEVYAVHLTDRNTGGGGTGSVQSMIDHVEGWINARIVLGKIEGAPARVEWHYNYRSPFTKEQNAEDTDPEAVMKNIAAQTGLTAKMERRKVKVLVVKKVP